MTNHHNKSSQQIINHKRQFYDVTVQNGDQQMTITQGGRICETQYMWDRLNQAFQEADTATSTVETHIKEHKL